MSERLHPFPTVPVEANRFAGLRVLVCGDAMLDRTLTGEVTRISPEAPVPVLTVEHEWETPGGAANVARNVAALGARCTLVALVGDDADGARLEAQLADAGVSAHLVRVPDWRTVLKMRATSGHQQLLRLDYERPRPGGEALARAREALAKRMAELAGGHAVTVFADYDKGALADAERLVELARAAGSRVVVDPKTPPFERWRGADVLKPNVRELAAAAEALALSEARSASAALEDVAACAVAVRERCGVGALVVTRGAAGMLLADAQGVRALPARTVDVFDVTGAGDTAAAVLATALAADMRLDDAAVLANLAASQVVERVGTAVVDAAELAGLAGAGEADGDRPAGDGGDAVMSPPALERAVTAARARGERIVFTNGCFDLLHAGHVATLCEAAALGDRLVVAVNDDASVRRLKGAARPLTPLAQRLTVLAGLAAVDWVTWFEEDTPEGLIERLRPDVLVKGGDYGVEGVVGAERVRAYGGRVHVAGVVAGCSTSALLARMRAGGDPGADQGEVAGDVHGPGSGGAE